MNTTSIHHNNKHFLVMDARPELAQMHELLRTASISLLGQPTPSIQIHIQHPVGVPGCQGKEPGIYIGCLQKVPVETAAAITRKYLRMKGEIK